MTRHELARMIAACLQVELSPDVVEDELCGWSISLPDGEPQWDNFGLVDERGQIRFTVKVSPW